MFIPVMIPGEHISEVHVSLETVEGFCKKDRQSTDKLSPTADRSPYFMVKTRDDEYEVSRETFDLLKSLVLRP